MKTLRLSVWPALLLLLGAGCASSPMPEQSHQPAGPNQDMASVAPPVTAARAVPPLHQAEMEAKEQALLRIKLTEMQAGNLLPRFGNKPVQPLGPAQELGALRREYAIATTAPAPLPGTAGAPGGGPAVPTPTGKASGTARPPSPGAQPAAPDPRASSPQPTTEPPKSESKAKAADPGAVPAKPSRRLSPEEIGQQQAAAELLALSEIVRLYMKREITPEHYQQRRAALFSSRPASNTEDPNVPTPTGQATGRPEPAATHQQALYELAWLSKLVRLYERGRITTEEYHRRRAEIFSSKPGSAEPPWWVPRRPAASKPLEMDLDAEPAQSPATEPKTSASDPIPTPTGKTNRKPILAVRDKEEALSDLLWLYLEDNLTAGEYHRHRAEVLSEP